MEISIDVDIGLFVVKIDDSHKRSVEDVVTQSGKDKFVSSCYKNILCWQP